jgi:hypothetical protein
MASTDGTLEIRGLSKQKMTELAKQARRRGVSPEQYVKDLVEEKLAIAREARTKTFAQIIGPAQEVDERELDKLVEASRTRYHQRAKR